MKHDAGYYETKALQQAEYNDKGIQIGQIYATLAVAAAIEAANKPTELLKTEKLVAVCKHCGHFESWHDETDGDLCGYVGCICPGYEPLQRMPIS